MPEQEMKSVAELMAAAAYDREVQFQIGLHYANGTGGVDRDYPKAVEGMRSAAERGHAHVQVHMSDFYYHGQGVTKDNRQSFLW